MTTQLVGTKKQVRWAVEIKAKLIADITDPAVLAWAEAKTDAAWWIENRQKGLNHAYLEEVLGPDRDLPLPREEVRAAVPPHYEVVLWWQHEPDGRREKAAYRIHFNEEVRTVDDLAAESKKAHQHRESALRLLGPLEPLPPLKGSSAEIAKAEAIREKLCLRWLDRRFSLLRADHVTFHRGRQVAAARAWIDCDRAASPSDRWPYQLPLAEWPKWLEPLSPQPSCGCCKSETALPGGG